MYPFRIVGVFFPFSHTLLFIKTAWRRTRGFSLDCIYCVSYDFIIIRLGSIFLPQLFSDAKFLFFLKYDMSFALNVGLLKNSKQEGFFFS